MHSSRMCCDIPCGSCVGLVQVSTQLNGYCITGCFVFLLPLVYPTRVLQPCKASEGASPYSKTVLSNCRCCIIVWEGYVRLLATLSIQQFM